MQRCLLIKVPSANETLSALQLTERDNRLSELEKKVKESEDKNRKMERTLKDNNERIADVEREVIMSDEKPLHKRRL